MESGPGSKSAYQNKIEYKPNEQVRLYSIKTFSENQKFRIFLEQKIPRFVMFQKMNKSTNHELFGGIKPD